MCSDSILHLVTPRILLEQLPDVESRAKSLAGFYKRDNKLYGTRDKPEGLKPKKISYNVSEYHSSLPLTNNLVFLKESDPQDDDSRLMQRPSLSTDSPEWFQDKRYHPKQQAEYLKKLSQKPHGLSLSQRSVSEVFTTRSNVENETDQKKNLPKLVKIKQPLTERYTDRQRKIQIERNRILERQNRFHSQSVGKLDIRPLHDNGSELGMGNRHDSIASDAAHESLATADTKVFNGKPHHKHSGKSVKAPKMNSVKLPYLMSRSDSNINTVHQNEPLDNDIFVQMMNIEKKKVNDSMPVLPAQYTSSIPNIGRRAVRDPAKLFYIDKETKEHGFMKHVNIRDRVKYYKGHGKKRRKFHTRAGDTDEISDLSSETDSYIRFHHDHSEQAKQSTPWEIDDDKYAHSIAPCTTPTNSHQFTQSEEVAYPDEMELELQYQRHKTHTEDSIYINRNVDYGDEPGLMLNTNGGHALIDDNCVFCQNPDLIPPGLSKSAETQSNPMHNNASTGQHKHLNGNHADNNDTENISTNKHTKNGFDNPIIITNPPARFKDITVEARPSRNSRHKHSKNTVLYLKKNMGSSAEQDNVNADNNIINKRKQIVVDLSHASKAIPSSNIESVIPTSSNVKKQSHSKSDRNNNSIPNSTRV